MSSGWVKDSYDRLGFGQLVAQLRHQLGWSYGQLASALGLKPGSKGSLQRAEQGKRALPAEQREKLVETLSTAAERKGLVVDRRQFLKLAGLTALAIPATRPVLPGFLSAAGPAPALSSSAELATGGPDLGWDAFMSLAGARALRGDQVGAMEAYAQAAAIATRSGARGKSALALARVAAHERALNRDERAWELSEQAFATMGYADRLRPDERPSVGQIESAIRDDAELSAYGEIVNVQAQVLINDEKWAEAEQYALTLQRLGDVTTDGWSRWQGRHLQGRILLEMGTDAGGDWAWRRIADERRVPGATAIVKRALDCFVAADELRKEQGYDLLLAHNLKNAYGAARLLDLSTDAARFEHQATEIFGSRSGATNLLMYRGRWAVATGDHAEAAHALHQSLLLASDAQIPLMMSASLAGLADLHASRAEWTAARDCCIASLLLWPYALRARDPRRVTRLLRKLVRHTESPTSTLNVYRVVDKQRAGFPFYMLPPRLDLASEHEPARTELEVRCARIQRLL